MKSFNRTLSILLIAFLLVPITSPIIQAHTDVKLDLNGEEQAALRQARQTLDQLKRSEDNGKLDPDLREYVETGVVPDGLYTYNEASDLLPSLARLDLDSAEFGPQFQSSDDAVGTQHPGIMILTDGSVGAQTIRQHARVHELFPLVESNLYLASIDSPQALLDLAAIPGVLHVYGDREFSPTPLERGREPVLPSQFNATEIQGVNDAWETFGVNGSGVTIAIVDTGVDFGVPDLTQARDNEGAPTSIGVVGVGVALASLDLEPIGDTLPTADRDIIIYIGGPDVNSHFIYTMPSNLTLSGDQLAESKSGVFRIGVHAFWDFAVGGYYIIPMVLTDSEISGLYDTVYFDLSTFYGELLTDATAAGFPNTLGLDPETLMDNSLSDEAPHRWGDGTEVVARDFNSDGIPDISMGSLAWTYDEQRGGGEGLIPGLGAIDPDNAALLEVDTLGIPVQEWSLVALQWPFAANHGTSVSSGAASTGENEYFWTGFPANRSTLPGMARGARIMGVNGNAPGGALSSGALLRGWFWAAGLDPTEVTDSGYTYVEARHADIISNSWGGIFPFSSFAPGVQLNDMVSNLLSIPGYLHEDYPGSVMVAATGNEGYGYGTVSSPSAATLGIAVGASTSWLYLKYWNATARGLQTTGYDEIASFSSRGPVTTGEVKPDVLAIGSWAIAITGIHWEIAGQWGIIGNGLYATTIFGGTSQATPMVSGAAAVVIEAMRATGVEVTPQNVKNILMSTAKDIGYDPYSQGAGRVDVYRAVSLVFSMADNEVGGQPMPLLVTSTETYSNVREIQNPRHVSNFLPLPDMAIPGGSVFAGRIPMGGATDFDVQISSFMDGDKEITATPTRLSKSREYSDTLEADFTLQPVLTHPNGTVLEQEALYLLNLTEFLESQGGSADDILDADFFSVYIAYDQGTYMGEIMPFVYLVDWQDLNSDGVFDYQNEHVRVRNDVRFGMVSWVSAGHPAGDFEGTPAIVLRSVVDPGLESTTFRIMVQSFTRTTWDQLSVQTSEVSSTAFQASVDIDVPSSATPGFYSGFLDITVSNGTLTESTLTPISFSVVASLTTPGQIKQFSGDTGDLSNLYENLVVFGGADSGYWSYGDFRFYNFEVTDADAEDLVISVSWPGALTQIDVVIVAPDGTVVQESPIAFTGGVPNYLYSTTTGETEQVMMIPVTQQGVYTVVVHNTVSQGETSFPVPVSIQALYTTEPTLELLLQPESEEQMPGLLERGWVFGDLNVTVAISQQAAGVAEVLGMTLSSGESLERMGTVTASHPVFTAPWGDVRPHVNETVTFEEGSAVEAIIDWTGADDVDLIPYDPNGDLVLTPAGTPAYEDSSTSAKPERTEFVTEMSGDYTFVVLLYAPLVETDYTLSLSIGGPSAISVSSEPETPASLVVDTEQQLPDEKDIEFSVDIEGFVFDVFKYPLSFSISVDNTPPSVLLTGVDDGEYILEPVRVRAVSRDTFFESATFSIDDSEQQMMDGVVLSQTLDLPDGDHVLRIRATDELGFVTEEQVTIHVDQSTPTIAITEGIVSGAFHEGPVDASAETRQLYIDRVTMSIDGGTETEIPLPMATDPSQTGSIDIPFALDTTDYGDGEHTIHVMSYYLSGKNASQTVAFNIDNNAPTLSVDGIPTADYVNTDQTLNIESSDVFLESVVLSVNGEDNDITGQDTISLFDYLPATPDGVYDLTITAFDQPGHSTEQTFSLTVDTTDPQAQITSPEAEAQLQGDVQIAFLADDLNLDEATLTINGETHDVAGQESFTWETGGLPDAEYTIVLEVTDLAGNTAEATITVSTINTLILLMWIAGAAVVIVVVAVAVFYLRRRGKSQQG